MGFWSDAWDTVTDTAGSIWDAVTTVGGAAFDILDVILFPFSWILSFGLQILYSIPVLGGILQTLINGITTFVWMLIGGLDFILSLIGIRPEKKLRVLTIVLKDSKGAFAQDNDILSVLSEFVHTFKNRCNVKVILAKPLNFTSGFQAAEEPTSEWLTAESTIQNDQTLDANCDSEGLLRDFNGGSYDYENMISKYSRIYSIRRLLGYGAPIFIFIIRKFNDGKKGCSNGLLDDYILIAGHALPNDKYLMAHESGHASNLFHSFLGSEYGQSNLMYPNSSRGNNLTSWQISTLRASRHATYF